MSDSLDSQRLRELGVAKGFVGEDFRSTVDGLRGFLLRYSFALREVETKISIIRDEFSHLHDYNPIEHVSSRVKSFESIRQKLEKRELPLSIESAEQNLTDIAGVRITCSFTPDVYRVQKLLVEQNDLEVRRVSDYIKEPKASGYRSLHTIIEIPVFLSTGPVKVPVEVQIRTSAMEFWASLEHKINYKYSGQVPEALAKELHDAATTAAELDTRMERLHRELHG